MPWIHYRTIWFSILSRTKSRKFQHNSLKIRFQMHFRKIVIVWNWIELNLPMLIFHDERAYITWVEFNSGDFFSSDLKLFLVLLLLFRFLFSQRFLKGFSTCALLVIVRKSRFFHLEILPDFSWILLKSGQYS